MKIEVYSEKDLKKSGGFKKKNNVLTFSKDEFIKYINDNKLEVSKGYIDLVGSISNGLKFRCYYNNFVVGVTKIIEECN